MQRLNIIGDIILHSNDIRHIGLKLSQKIDAFYKSNDNIIIVLVVLQGALNFARQVVTAKASPTSPIKFKIHEIRASSYGNETESCGKVKVDLRKCPNLEGRDVLVIDDIYDTGKTLNAIRREVEKQKPKSIEYCVMLERVVEREGEINPRFIGEKVNRKEFLVGGGLDFQGRLRDLPYVGTLNAEGMDWDPETDKIHKVCFCNQCGERCVSPTEPLADSHYGLIGAVARGHYCSPVLDDCTAYKFDLCEQCLEKMFSNFKLPVDEAEYDIWTGEVYE